MQVKDFREIAARGDWLPIAEALRLIRTRRGLTQTAFSKLPGAPDFRTLSHWETGRKVPSLRLLFQFLTAAGLDFRDLQDVFDQLEGRIAEGLETRLSTIGGKVTEARGEGDRTAESLAEVERRLAVVERQAL